MTFDEYKEIVEGADLGNNPDGTAVTIEDSYMEFCGYVLKNGEWVMPQSYSQYDTSNDFHLVEFSSEKLTLGLDGSVFYFKGNEIEFRVKSMGKGTYVNTIPQFPFHKITYIKSNYYRNLGYCTLHFKYDNKVWDVVITNITSFSVDTLPI